MKLSVMVITYNHERFIAQALESVLAQRVNFDYEIVVGEDCSTDRTPDIVMDFHRRYPGRIVPLLRKQNIGGPENSIATRTSCRGQYVAMLEGDDYWTCEDKLQRQVDFLEAHPDCALCCHRAKVLDETGTWQHASVIPSIAAGPYTVDDLLEVNFVVTGSTVFRPDTVGPVPDWFRKTTLGDWPLFALIARHGKIALMDEAMSVYRVHSGGLWSARPEIDHQRAIIRMLKALDKHLEFQYTNTIRRTIACYGRSAAEAHLGMAHTAREKGNRARTAKNVAGYLWDGGLKLPDTWRAFASFTAYTLLGSWYEAIRKAKRANRS